MPGMGRGVRSGLGCGSSQTGTQIWGCVGATLAHTVLLTQKCKRLYHLTYYYFQFKTKQNQKRIASNRKISKPLTGGSFIKMHP